MLVYVLYGIFILACIVLVISVLLQPGKSDAGALFSSSVSSTAFGPRGTATLLAKITIGAASLYMLVALSLSLPVLTGKRSVVESSPAASPSPAAAPAPPVTAPPAAVASPVPSVGANANPLSLSPGLKAEDALIPAATPAKAKASPAASKR